jgi:hypothetical protein
MSLLAWEAVSRSCLHQICCLCNFIPCAQSKFGGHFGISCTDIHCVLDPESTRECFVCGSGHGERWILIKFCKEPKFFVLKFWCQVYYRYRYRNEVSVPKKFIQNVLHIVIYRYVFRILDVTYVTKKKISNFSVSHIVVKMLYAGAKTEVIHKVKSEPHKNWQTLDILLSHSKIVFYLFKSVLWIRIRIRIRNNPNVLAGL